MGIADDIGGHFGSLGKQLGQSIALVPKEVVKTAGAQVGIEIKDREKNKEVPQPGAAEKPQLANPEAAQTQKNTESFVNDLYGVTTKPPEAQAAVQTQVQNAEKPKTQQQKAFERIAALYPTKSHEEIQKMVSMEQEAQNEYYQKLTTPVKRPEEAQEEQERASERVERLKMEDLQEEKKKKEKAKPIPQEATKTEAPMGAG